MSWGIQTRGETKLINLKFIKEIEVWIQDSVRVQFQDLIGDEPLKPETDEDTEDQQTNLENPDLNDEQKKLYFMKILIPIILL